MKSNTIDYVYGLLLWVGLTLQLLAIDLFRLTFISTAVSVGIYLGAGLIGFFLLRPKIKGTFKNKVLDLIVSLAWCVVSIGGILIFLILATNYYLAQQETTRQNYPILTTGTLGKGVSSTCYQPYADVEKEGLVKEIIFDCNLPKGIAAYQSIDLTTSKGALGFDIIRNKQLVEKTAANSNSAAETHIE